MSACFCAVPWTQVIVRGNGSIQVCNRMSGRLGERDGGSALDIRRDRGDAVWNGPELVELRRALAGGEQPSSCRECWHNEALGAVSLRTTRTAEWKAGYLNPDGLDVAEAVSDAAARGYRLGRGPAAVQFDLGNLCNLACRMCNAGASSRVNGDPVHGAWTGRSEDVGGRRDAWFRHPEHLPLALDLLRDAQQLHLIGGEPLLIDDVGDLLRHVVEAGLAPQMDVSLHTNATVASRPWFSLFSHFRSVVFYVSIDGFGSQYEYIRYPARWSRIERNVAALRARGDIEVRAHTVVQNYNVLRIVELLRWCDGQAIPCAPHLLDSPTRLRASVLPRAGRELAADRIDAYLAEAPADAAHRELEGIVSYLRSAPAPSRELIRQFMIFTNDLDRSRGQAFGREHPEIVRMFEQEGTSWLPTVRFADRPAARAVALRRGARRPSVTAPAD